MRPAERRERRAKMRRARYDRMVRFLPRLREFCARVAVTMRKTDGGNGWEFRRGEYILLWTPATNTVVIQTTLRGSADVRFKEPGRPGRPRILVALERVCSVRPGVANEPTRSPRHRVDGPAGHVGVRAVRPA